MSSSAIKKVKAMRNIKSCLRYNSMKKNRGFTLLEAIIGFLVLSIGMLGIASLQAISLKSGKTSIYNSVAMMKVDELIESARANPGGLAFYAGADSSGTNYSCTGATNCTEEELALDDVYWWRQNLKAGLPAAATTNVVVVAAVAPSKMATVTVDVNWDERNNDAAGSIARSVSITTNVCTSNPC